MMKRLALAAVVAIAALAVPVQAATFTWGDFTFTDEIIDVDAWAFYDDDTMPQPTNPAGFPAPVAAGVSGNYVPAAGSRLLVSTLENYYTSQSCPNNTIALYLRIAGGATTFSQLGVAIDGTDVNGGAGPLVLTPGIYGILTGLDLSSFPNTNRIQITYAAPMGSDNIREMKFACTPEPFSIALLGTGFVGMVIARTRRRRKT